MPVYVLVETDVLYAAMLLSMSLGDQPLLVDSEQTTPYPHILYSSDEDIFGPLTTFVVFADRTHIKPRACVWMPSLSAFLHTGYFIFNIPKAFMGYCISWTRSFFAKSVRISQRVSTFFSKFWSIQWWHFQQCCTLCSWLCNTVWLREYFYGNCLTFLVIAFNILPSFFLSKSVTASLCRYVLF